MGEIRLTEHYGTPPEWEPEHGEEIVIDPSYMKTTMRSIRNMGAHRKAWIQIKLPYAVYDLHHRIYQNLHRFGENAVEHAVRMSSPLYSGTDKGVLPSQREPETWGWLRGCFLYACFPTGSLEKQAILESRRAEFNRLVNEQPERFGIFTVPERVSDWERYVALNRENSADPYDQIEYLIRRGAGLVNSFEEHRENPVSRCISPGSPPAI